MQAGTMTLAMATGGTADIAVITHDSRPDLERCFAHIAARAPEAGGRVIVVDNASNDGSADLACSIGGSVVEPVRLPHNGGYAHAVNEAARHSSAPYLMVLNPDVVLEPGVVARLVGHLEGHPRAGAAVPRLLDPEGGVQGSARVVPTLSMLVARQTRLSATGWGRRRSARYLRPPREAAGHVAVEWALGAAMCIRRADFDLVGGWDERFFLYFEDVDFCVRLSDSGREVHYISAVSAVHHHRRGSRREEGSLITSRARRAHVTSAMRFFAKHPRYAFRQGLLGDPAPGTGGE